MTRGSIREYTAQVCVRDVIEKIYREVVLVR
jgi:hypothetical protein